MQEVISNPLAPSPGLNPVYQVLCGERRIPVAQEVTLVQRLEGPYAFKVNFRESLSSSSSCYNNAKPRNRVGNLDDIAAWKPRDLTSDWRGRELHAV